MEWIGEKRGEGWGVGGRGGVDKVGGEKYGKKGGWARGAVVIGMGRGGGGGEGGRGKGGSEGG